MKLNMFLYVNINEFYKVCIYIYNLAKLNLNDIIPVRILLVLQLIMAKADSKLLWLRRFNIGEMVTFA